MGLNLGETNNIIMTITRNKLGMSECDIITQCAPCYMRQLSNSDKGFSEQSFGFMLDVASSSSVQEEQRVNEQEEANKKAGQ